MFGLQLCSLGVQLVRARHWHQGVGGAQPRHSLLQAALGWTGSRRLPLRPLDGAEQAACCGLQRSLLRLQAGQGCRRSLLQVQQGWCLGLRVQQAGGLASQCRRLADCGRACR